MEELTSVDTIDFVSAVYGGLIRISSAIVDIGLEKEVHYLPTCETKDQEVKVSVTTSECTKDFVFGEHFSIDIPNLPETNITSQDNGNNLSIDIRHNHKDLCIFISSNSSATERPIENCLNELKKYSDNGYKIHISVWSVNYENTLSKLCDKLTVDYFKIDLLGFRFLDNLDIFKSVKELTLVGVNHGTLSRCFEQIEKVAKLGVKSLVLKQALDFKIEQFIDLCTRFTDYGLDISFNRPFEFKLKRSKLGDLVLIYYYGEFKKHFAVLTELVEVLNVDYVCFENYKMYDKVVLVDTEVNYTIASVDCEQVCPIFSRLRTVKLAQTYTNCITTSKMKFYNKSKSKSARFIQ